MKEYTKVKSSEVCYKYTKGLVVDILSLYRKLIERRPLMHNLLQFKDIKIETKHDSIFFATELHRLEHCTYCGDDNIGLHGKKVLSVKHILQDEPCTIIISRQRYICRECGRTFVLPSTPLSDINVSHRITNHAATVIKEKASSHSQRYLAEKYKISRTVIKKIIE